MGLIYLSKSPDKTAMSPSEDDLDRRRLIYYKRGGVKITKDMWLCRRLGRMESEAMMMLSLLWEWECFLGTIGFGEMVNFEEGNFVQEVELTIYPRAADKHYI